MNIKRTLIKTKWFVPSMLNKSIMKLRHITYGKRLTTYGSIFIRGTGSISIGHDVTITSCRETNPIGGDTKTILMTKGTGTIIIGNNCGISNTTIVSIEKIEIEDNVFIGGNCKIYDLDFHSINFTNRMQSPDPDIKSRPVVIKNGAFIGAHSIILKGVTIGRRSVVGAGSVVTKSIPDGQIWAGNPAKFIRLIERDTEND